MKHDCKCDQNFAARPPTCPIHPTCACGCARRDHDEGGIGQCTRKGCHGCPEYRPAKLQAHHCEMTDKGLDSITDLERLRELYRDLRAHHIEETTVLLARSRAFPNRNLALTYVPESARVAADVEAAYDRMLQIRHVNVDSVCQLCQGYGTRMYSNTSAWRGGMGGAAMTTAICDQCWGSGDRDRPWRDLRTIDEETSQQVAERAVDALARSCGATFATSRESVKQIIDHLHAMTRKRKVDGIWTVPLVNGLANLLRRAIGEPEVKL